MSILLKTGLALGIISFCLLILQVVLTCRFKPLERIFGLDRLTNFHKNLGIAIGLLLTAHITIMLSLIKGQNFAIAMGQTAYGIAFANIVLALSFEAFGMDYNVWRVIHKMMPLVVLAAFIHSYLIGPDLRNAGMKILWWTLLGICAIAVLYRNLYIPLFRRKKYDIKSIEQVTHNTFTLTYLPQKGKRFVYIPGQFLFLKLIRPGRKSETHPFSISSSPTQGDLLQNTIKQSGNYTNTIDQTLVSDKAIIEGPYGRYSFLKTPSKSLLFIAGGVGITPIMSMIRYLRDTDDKRQAVLLNSNRAYNDIIFKTELENLPANFRVVHVLSDAEKDWNGLKGRITKNIIEENSRDILSDADVFLCGPPKMMQMMVNHLRELKVPKARVHYERFTI
ncbi:MAG: Phenol hydroxylase P5 protein [Planctomycetes bacterium ADurb.Bin401]|nr:MAG: Phenol hydroxylase P5 protein [Planctomycetes bacterium ADurb.Bin401]